MKNGEPLQTFSMKLGAVGLTEKFLFSNPPKKKEFENLQVEIVAALQQPLRKTKNAAWQFSTGTSGTILNLAELLNFQIAGNATAKPEIQLKKLIALNKMMAGLPLEERAKLPVISPQRAEVIVAGGLILEGVMRAFRYSNVAAVRLRFA
ncbi:MAG: hypothetical protein WKF71_11320 [Pyrinomonadaceae bacterium]